MDNQEQASLRHSDAETLSSWQEFKAFLGPTRSMYELHRLVGFPLFAVSIKLGIKPNYLTVLSLIIGLAGAFPFLLDSYIWNIVGILLVNLGLAIDTIDGPVARYQNTRSEFGVWLSALGVTVKTIAIWSCVAIGVYWERGEPTPLILGIVVLGHLFLSYHLLRANRTYDFYKYAASGSITFGSGRQVGLEIVLVGLLSLFALLSQLYIALYILAIAGAVPWIILLYRAVQSFMADESRPDI